MKCINQGLLIKPELINKYGKFWKLSAFKKEFNKTDLEIRNGHNKAWIITPCGKCDICLLNRKSFIIQRAKNEYKKWRFSYFITLTYTDKNNPGVLNKKHVQNFFKYLKKELKQPISYLYCGEYGTKTKRPHYHLILWMNHKLNLIWLKKQGANDYYICDLINKCWKNQGFHTIGITKNEAIEYVAKYTMKDSYKSKINKFKVKMNYFKKELEEKNIKGIEYYIKFDNEYNKGSYLWEQPLPFIKWSHKMGFLGYEQINTIPHYYLKKYLKNMYPVNDLMKLKKEDRILKKYQSLRMLAKARTTDRNINIEYKKDRNF